MKYTNYKCPVCEAIFNEEDDVVVCAECGTPHHRECYNQTGECYNHKKHGTNQPIEVEFVDVEEENSTPDDVQPEATNAQQIAEEIVEQFSNNPNDYTINGNPVSYYEAAVKKNQKFYIPRFMLMAKSQKGVYWNIGGFFVPLAWSLYRKMYKLAALVFALYVVVFGSLFYSMYSNEAMVNAVNECYEEDPAYAQKILLYQAGTANVTLTEKQMNLNKLSTEFKFPTIVVVIRYVITYGIRILLGIYATKLYFNKISKKIDQVEKLNASADMKRSILYRSCGTIPIVIAAIIGFFEWQMF